ncbi:MAG: DUF4407 domain-containing protein [Bacteroidota bacterium]
MDPYENYTDEIYQDEAELSGVKRFFFACAGAYIKILKAVPSEHSKYVGIGATIFLTACLAVLSGTFAIYTLVENVPLAFLFGLLWGALIFNLDRYIVSSIRKEGRPWAEFGLAFPRLILAVLISVVITKPIEIELFRNQINAEMLNYTNQLQKEGVQQLDDRLGLDSLNLALAELDSVRLDFKKRKEGKPMSFDFGEVSREYSLAKSAYDSLVKTHTPRIQANEKRRTYLWNKYATKVYEDDGNGGQRFVRYDFPAKWQDRNNQLYRINKELRKEIDTQLAEVQKLESERREAKDAYSAGMAEELALIKIKREELVTAKAEMEAIRKEALPEVREKAQNYGKGFAARIKVLEKMKEEDSAIWWMSNLIMLLFIMLETSPVFVKLVTKRGPYDYLLSRIEHHKKIEALRYISDMNYDLNANMRLKARQNGSAVKGQRYGEEVLSNN